MRMMGPAAASVGGVVAGPDNQPARQTTGYTQQPVPTGVEGAGEIGGHGCGARGRWWGLAGLRGDAPSEARGADGSRAGRRPRARRAARPTARPDGARNTCGAVQYRQNLGGMPRKQGRQVDATAARKLRGLGAAGEAVRQVHRIRLGRQGLQQ